MNMKRNRAPKIRGSRTKKVQALNKELELAFADDSKMTDELYEELEGLTF
jgi:hypothetical protein